MTKQRTTSLGYCSYALLLPSGMLLAQAKNAVTPDLYRDIASIASCKATAFKPRMWSLLQQMSMQGACTDAPLQTLGVGKPCNVGLDF